MLWPGSSHALNQGLNKVSATSVYNLGIAALQLQERDLLACTSKKSEVLRDVYRQIFLSKHAICTRSTKEEGERRIIIIRKSFRWLTTFRII
jgi:hypothetical protein